MNSSDNFSPDSPRGPVDPADWDLFCDVLRIANGKPLERGRSTPDWFDPSLAANRSAEAYFAKWGSVIRSYLANWTSESFAEDVWLAARVIGHVTIGTEASAVSEKSETVQAFTMVARLVGNLFPKYGIHGGDVSPSHETVKEPTLNARMQYSGPDCGNYRFKLSYREEAGGQLSFTPGVRRRTIELAIHEFRHFHISKAMRLVPDEGYDPHDDSPYEIDARLFQRLVYELAADLASVKNLHGACFFSPLVGPPFPSEDEVAHSIAIYTGFRLALDQAHADQVRRCGKPLFIESLLKISKYAENVARRLRQLDVLISSTSDLEFQQHQALIEKNLQQIANSTLQECADFGDEWRGYYYKRTSAGSPTSSKKATSNGRLAVDLFLGLFQRKRHWRFFRYALLAAKQCGTIDAESFLVLWTHLCSMQLKGWRQFYDSRLGAFLEKQSARGDRPWKALFSEAQARALSDFQTRISGSSNWGEIHPQIEACLSSFHGARVEMGNEFNRTHGKVHGDASQTVWLNQDVQLPFYDPLLSAQVVCALITKNITVDAADAQAAREIMGITQIWTEARNHVLRQTAWDTRCETVFELGHELTCVQSYFDEDAPLESVVEALHDFDAMIDASQPKQPAN